MVLEVEFPIPAAPPEALRQHVLALAPHEGEDYCPQCGADRFHLVDALLDTQSWQNRGLAASLIGGCTGCKAAVAELIAKEAQGIGFGVQAGEPPSTEIEA